MKIGLVGVGHLGKIHLKCLKETPFILEGFYDVDATVREHISKEHNLKAYASLDEMLSEVDCLDIVSPTPYHYDIASKAIKEGKHVFIEKPITETIEQAEDLALLAQKYNVKVQVGHVERYNPAIRSMESVVIRPKFIEGHRLAIFNPRGTDVSVVLDLMIHDIDIVLNMVKSEVKEVRANGVRIVSKTPDICTARIEFENGAVANLTASRISMKNMRKIRVFQEDAYISLDFLDKEAQIIKIEKHIEDDNFSGMTIPTNDGLKRIIIESPTIMQNNAIKDELTDFYYSCTQGAAVSVTLEDGLNALKLAQLIQTKIDENL